jgi:hypothetical protein
LKNINENTDGIFSMNRVRQYIPERWEIITVNATATINSPKV